MTFIKAFGQFWYDFIIGDDWKIAAAVITALAMTFGLYATGLTETVTTIIGGVLILAFFVGVLLIDTRSKGV